MDETDIRQKFKKLIDDLGKWGKKVDEQILKILRINGFTDYDIKIPPNYRLKRINSFVSKAFYREKNYKSPIKDIEDKVGTRIVLLKSDQVNKTANILLNNNDIWEAKITKRIDSELRDKPKSFDYQSIHIVVIPKKDMGFDTKKLSLLSCEIQIRSLLQHAFAEVSHDSVYKGPYKNDHKIIRSLSKAMALMEATDDYFCEIFDLMTDEKRKYSAFTKSLIQEFNKFQTFSKEELDIHISDLVFECTDSIDINDIELNTFVNKYKTEIKKVIEELDYYITTQPIIILIAFFIIYSPAKIKEHWPFDSKVLKNVFLKMGTSFEKY